MTAREILNNALKLLGYTEANGNGELPQRISNRAVAVINVIYAELWRTEGKKDFEPITNLADKINLSERVLNEIMPCGVAMMIAGSESDGDNQSFWAEVYNRKRATMTRIVERTDELPTAEE